MLGNKSRAVSSDLSCLDVYAASGIVLIYTQQQSADFDIGPEYPQIDYTNPIYTYELIGH